jgi:hypothetical protein
VERSDRRFSFGSSRRDGPKVSANALTAVENAREIAATLPRASVVVVEHATHQFDFLVEKKRSNLAERVGFERSFHASQWASDRPGRSSCRSGVTSEAQQPFSQGA